MKKLKVLSLFSGIGAFEKALTNLGINYELVGFSEIDKYAIKSYCAIHNVDESLNFGDISEVDKSKLPDFDLLVGGSPCQAFSVAGQRKGFKDTRGTLFFDYVETLKYKQPKFFVFENVKGLINHDKGKTLDIIAQSFSEVGYRIDMELLNGKYFDVPQNRERIYIVGIREDLIEQQEWIIPKERKDVMAKGKRRLKELGIKMFNFDFPKQERVSKVIRDILESDVNEKYYLSEDKTKTLIEKLQNKQDKREINVVGKLGCINNDMRSRVYDIDGISPTLNTSEGGNNEPKIIESNPKMIGMIDIKGNESIRRVYDVDGLSPTLTTMEGGHREPKIVVEYDRKNGIGEELDVAHTLNSSDWRGLNRNQKQNAVLESKIIDDTQNFDGIRLYDEIVPTLRRERHGLKVVEEFLIDDQGRSNKKLKPMNISPTLRSESHGNEPKIVESKYRIRKLTPLECWRLQAFDDEDFYKAKEALINTYYKGKDKADSQLYKQAGNSIVVNVLEEIFKNLLKDYFKN